MRPGDIDACLPRRIYVHGLCVPQTFSATLEFRRDVYELRDGTYCYGYPSGYTEQHHERIRWARFGLIWPAIGAQKIIEREVAA